MISVTRSRLSKQAKDMQRRSSWVKYAATTCYIFDMYCIWLWTAKMVHVAAMLAMLLDDK